MKDKKKTIIIVNVIVVVTILLCLGITYLNYNHSLYKIDKHNKNNEITNNKTDKKDEKKDNNESNLDFDFNGLTTKVNNLIQTNNYSSMIVNCSNVTTNTNQPPVTKNEVVSLSNDSFNTVISKLKEASSVESTTASWFGCPPNNITYHVSVFNTDFGQVKTNEVFSLSYANSDAVLLVGYENNGYAFRYDDASKINNFIESLK